MPPNNTLTKNKKKIADSAELESLHEHKLRTWELNKQKSLFVIFCIILLALFIFLGTEFHGVFTLLDLKTKQDWIEKTSNGCFTLLLGIAGTLGIQNLKLKK